LDKEEGGLYQRGGRGREKQTQEGERGPPGNDTLKKIFFLLQWGKEERRRGRASFSKEGKKEEALPSRERGRESILYFHQEPHREKKKKKKKTILLRGRGEVRHSS